LNSYTLYVDSDFWIKQTKWALKKFSRVFAKLRKATVSFVMSVRLSARPHGKTRFLQTCFHTISYF